MYIALTALQDSYAVRRSGITSTDTSQVDFRSPERRKGMIACSLFRTLDSIAKRCSVKAYGRYRRPPRPLFEVANCNLKSFRL